VALHGCLRSEEELQNVAQWAVGFLDRAIDFLTGAVEQGVFPGNDWTLRQCCVTSPVPGPPSELVLVDAETVENIQDTKQLPSKLKQGMDEDRQWSSWSTLQSRAKTGAAQFGGLRGTRLHGGALLECGPCSG
jgi:hypothetical protein